MDKKYRLFVGRPQKRALTKVGSKPTTTVTVYESNKDSNCLILSILLFLILIFRVHFVTKVCSLVFKKIKVIFYIHTCVHLHKKIFFPGYGLPT